MTAKKLYRGIGPKVYATVCRMAKSKADRAPHVPVNQKVARAFFAIDFLIAFNVILWVVSGVVCMVYCGHAS
jgi:hypothetical protein